MKKRISALAAVLLLVFGTAAAQAADGRIYEITVGRWDDYQRWYVDRDGNELATDDDYLNYYVYELDDVATNETRYHIRSRDEVVYEGEYPRPETWYSLCRPDGTVILDWERMSYSDAFGDFIIRQEGGFDYSYDPEVEHHSALYHVPTGTESFVGACNAEEMDDGRYLLTDRFDTAMFIVDAEGNAVSTAPEGKYYEADAFGGYIIATTASMFERTKEEPGEYVILDDDWNEVFRADWISESYGYMGGGDYVAFSNDDTTDGAYSPVTGKQFTAGSSERIEYFDGELAVTEIPQITDTGADYFLVNGAGGYTVVAEGFNWLLPDKAREDSGQAQSFIGIRNGKAERIDRSGKVVDSVELPPNTRTLDRLSEGLYTFNVYNDTTNTTGLLNSDLEIIVPAGTYIGIYLASGMYDQEIAPEDVLLQADKYVNGRVYRSDILDATGKVIVKNATSIYECSSDRIALQLGFNCGLMDRDGNWIVKRSIFTNVTED